MKTKLLTAIVCVLVGQQVATAETVKTAPDMWPVSTTIETETPFVSPLEEVFIKFGSPIKLMETPTEPIVVKCNDVVVAEATSFEVINPSDVNCGEGLLTVNFEKQNLPKGAAYRLCIPEGMVGSRDIMYGYQRVNSAIDIDFCVPSTLEQLNDTQVERYYHDSESYIMFYWRNEIKPVGEPVFHLYRENEKIAELPVNVECHGGFGEVSPVFNEYTTFDKGVSYKLVLPAGSVSAAYRDDIENEEIVCNFTGAYVDPKLPFTYDWCSLATDYSGVLGVVSFRFQRPFLIEPDAKIQLFELYPSQQLIMEVTPWINTSVNCFVLECDFGGYTPEDERGFLVVIPEGALVSADGEAICARSEFRYISTGVGKIGMDSDVDNSQPYFNLQGIKVDQPQKGNLYIHKGKKIIIAVR